MPRTPIPVHLIHRPEEVERNADRFDQLCWLAEDVAYPVVENALIRETATTGSRAITDEAKYVLEMLAEDAAVLNQLDEETVLSEVQKSLSLATLQPDKEECLQHTQEVSQVMMSTWLEIIRSAQTEEHPLSLSDHMIPQTPSKRMTWLRARFGSDRPKLPQDLADALSSFAVNEGDAAAVMATLRDKLFPEPCLVGLPFDLALVGAPEQPTLSMTRPLYEHLLWEMGYRLEKMAESRRRDVERYASQCAAEQRPRVSRFVSDTARDAIDNLTEPLSPFQYGYLAMVASPSVYLNIKPQVKEAVAAQVITAS